MRYRYFIPYAPRAATVSTAFSFPDSHVVHGATPEGAASAALADSGNLLAPRFILIPEEGRVAGDPAYELYVFDVVKQPRACVTCGRDLPTRLVATLASL